MKRMMAFTALMIGFNSCNSEFQKMPYDLAVVTQLKDGYRYEIFTVNSGGGVMIQLTDNEERDDYPSWSPDGSTIVYSSTIDGPCRIFKMNSDGTNKQRLTPDSVYNDRPVMSPAGDKIAFFKLDSLYVMNTDGSGLIFLTLSANPNTPPSWSPDGQKLAYGSIQLGYPDIWAIEVDGENEVNLTHDDYSEGGLSWSPDGQEIVFTAVPDGSTQKVIIMNADGSNQRDLGRGRIDYESKSVSYGNDRIAFVFNGDLYVMNKDGTGRVRMASHTQNIRNPQWAPDDSRIAYMVYTYLDDDEHSDLGYIYCVDLKSKFVTEVCKIREGGKFAWSPVP